MSDKDSCRSCPTASGCGSAAGASGTPLKLKNPGRAEQDARISSVLSAIRHKLFIMSGKGGVGKSSIAVNIAAALAGKGFRVGILDVDIHGPSVPNLLGISGQFEMEGRKIKPHPCGENLQVVSMESLLEDPDQAVLWRGPMKTSAIRQFIADVEWGELDFLVVDSPPGTGDEHMTILKTIRDALCVVVTTPQEVSLADVRKALNFLQYARANILGVVENMSGLICPHCAREIDLFRKGGGKALAERYGLPFLGAIPLDPTTVVAGEVGRPVVSLEGQSPVKEALLQLADTVVRETMRNLEAAASHAPAESGGPESSAD